MAFGEEEVISRKAAINGTFRILQSAKIKQDPNDAEYANDREQGDDYRDFTLRVVCFRIEVANSRPDFSVRRHAMVIRFALLIVPLHVKISATSSREMEAD
jgi:hypothetical protein